VYVNIVRGMAKRKRTPKWAKLPQDELLDLRICDLGITLEGSWVEPLIERVGEELAARDLDFGPRFWLADEWFSPNKIPGVGVPFYLAHPRLMRLERSQMLEVEGGNKEDCLKLLRHELGHAIDHAYRLSRRRLWRETFGSPAKPYPDWYRPNPASKSYVHNLDAWYAQAHPDEDFAETFAVWLAPRSKWRKRYVGWPALRKLEAVEELMQSIAGDPPVVRSRAQPYSLSTLRRTLRTHYKRKRERYSPGFSTDYDRDLRRLFDGDPRDTRYPTAAAFLRKHGKEIRKMVTEWTGGYEFTVDYVLKDITGRCMELKLRTRGSERKLKVEFAILLTVHSMTYLYRGRDWHAL
jgi:hypothetical protein